MYKFFFVLAGRGSRVLNVDVLNVTTVAYSSSQFSESRSCYSWPAQSEKIFGKCSVLAEWCVFYQIVKILQILTAQYRPTPLSFVSLTIASFILTDIQEITFCLLKKYIFIVLEVEYHDQVAQRGVCPREGSRCPREIQVV